MDAACGRATFSGYLSMSFHARLANLSVLYSGACMIGIDFGRTGADLSVAEVAAMRPTAVDLLFATAPSLYGYQFGHDRKLFNVLVGAAWEQKDNLFSHSATTLALDGDELIGLIIGCYGRDFQPYARALNELWGQMVARGEVSADLMSVLERNAPHCSYLTPKVPDSAFYVLGLSVLPGYQRHGVGVRLLHLLTSRVAEDGAASMHLDVVSDNPAVRFYSAMGLECVAETRSPEAHRNGVPMMMRMVKWFT